MKSNINKYHFFSLFLRLTFYSPVFVILLTNNGLTLLEVLTVQAIHSLGAMLAEVPCGAFADRYSKRLSLIIGSFVWALSLLFYGLSDSFFTFASWAFVGGIGQAFLSGADSALLHESLKSLGRDEEFESIEGKSRGAYTVAGILTTGLSGVIAKVSIPLTLYLSAVNAFIATAIAVTFKTPSVDVDLNRPGLVQIIRNGLASIFKSQSLLWLSIYLALSNGIIWSLNGLTQPYLQQISFPLEYFGLLFAFFGVIAAVVSFNVSRVKKFSSQDTLLFILLFCALSILLIGTFENIYVLLLWVIIEIAIVVTPFLVTARTLEIVSASDATTVLSFQGLFVRVVNIAVSPAIGFLAINVGISNSFKLIGIFFLFIFVYLFITRSK